MNPDATSKLPSPLQALPERQRRALPVILSASSIAAGCESAKVGRRTFYRWRRDPAFRRAILALEEAAHEAGLSLLRSSFVGIVERLLELTQHPTPGVRLQALSVAARLATEAGSSSAVGRRLARIEEQEDELR